jgi:hypothetical protein
MQFNYSIYLWQQLQRHYRPSYYMPYFISYYSAPALEYSPITRYFPKNQPSKPSRGVCLVAPWILSATLGVLWMGSAFTVVTVQPVPLL